MRLLQRDGLGAFTLTSFRRPIPPYAILSHRWTDDEPNHRDIIEGKGHQKTGFEKLRFCASQAEKDDLKFFWIDTVCIDKSSSAELFESLNCMFRWYQDAERCYVFLSDIASISTNIKTSEWWTRGWTLQELLSPRVVEFYTSTWELIGTKISLESQICDITGIPIAAVRGEPLSSFSPLVRMSWAQYRITTLDEDKAYCLLGILGILMPVIYGEGKKAFQRLCNEVEKSDTEERRNSGLLIVRNRGYNCFGRITWDADHSMYETIPWLGSCSKCGFSMIPEDWARPHLFRQMPLYLEDGRTAQNNILWQRFHHKPSDGSSSSVFRCFICRSGEALEELELREHLRAKHTLEQIWADD